MRIPIEVGAPEKPSASDNTLAKTERQKTAMNWPVIDMARALDQSYRLDRMRGKVKFSTYLVILRASLVDAAGGTDTQYWWISHAFHMRAGAKDSTPRRLWNSATEGICKGLVREDLQGVGVPGSDVWHMDGEYNIGLMRRCTKAEEAWILEYGLEEVQHPATRAMRGQLRD